MEQELDECLPEDIVSFVDECTCAHEKEEHGFCGCNVDKCDCKAHWEE